MYTCPLMSHHTHDIFEESMCVLSTDTSGRYAHVFYVSVPACCYSRLMPDHTWHVLPLNTYVKRTLTSWMTGEHCSDYLKQKIRKLQLDNVRDIQNAIRREWQRLQLGYIRRLVRSMRRRSDAVFKANGGHTRY